jgi:predicted Zn-dependent protease
MSRRGVGRGLELAIARRNYGIVCGLNETGHAGAIMPSIESFEKLLAAGKDNPLLRFSLGNEYLKLGRPDDAALHLREATRQDPKYTAAWKLLGKALAETGDKAGAIEAFDAGLKAAELHGDKQAAKEMTVFRKRALREDA